MTPPASTETVLIIGAGIIGIACAHYLLKSGYKVTVIDKGSIAGACSHGNCGHILPSDVLPLNSVSAMKTALASLFNPSSSFRVKPRLEAAFLNWLWQFTKRCHGRHKHYAAGQLKPLLSSAFREYQVLTESPSFKCGWNPRGLLYVFHSSTALQKFSQTNQWLSANFDILAKPLDGGEISDFDPTLSEELAGAFYYENDACLRPDQLAMQWSDQLKSEGVVFRENCEFETLEKAGARITAIHTTKGVFKADHVVLATGAMSGQFAKAFECAIPVEPGKGYSVTLEKPENCPKTPLILLEQNIAITPFQDSLRIGSMMEFVGFDDSLPAYRIQQLCDRSEPYLRCKLPEKQIESWFGWRPMTWDGLPIIGRAPKLKNAYLAMGHNMIGVMTAPATGKLIAELISEQKPHINDVPFSAARFN